MKNLRTSNFSTIHLPEADSDRNAKLCVDPLNERVYILRGKTICSLGKDGVFNAFDLLESLNLLDVVLFDYLSDENQICIVLKSGQMFLVDVETETVSEMGMVSGEVYGGAWSPDQQLLILATEDELFAITRDFEISRQESLRPEGRGKDELLTVGWGSRETQFQGSAGRKNREKIDINRVPIQISDADDRFVLVSWRADGQFFTVSTVDEIENRLQISTLLNNDGMGDGQCSSVNCNMVECRQLRIWDRNVELMSKCEFLAGMEDCLCVRPIGNLIAVSQLLNGSRFVRFFERNGQYRSNFLLQADADKYTVKFFGWNNDATILAIYLVLKRNDLEGDSEEHQVQFWTVSNYDWAQKLQYTFEESLESILWDPENSYLIHILFGAGRKYRYADLYSMYLFENCIVASISGDKIRLTNLALASVPPPMSHNVLHLNSAVAEITICNSRLAIVSTDFRFITIYNIRNVFEPVLESNFQILSNSKDFTLLNLQWRASDLLSAVCGNLLVNNSRNGSFFELIEIDMDGNIMKVFKTEEAIIWHKFNSDTGFYDVILADGRHFNVSKNETKNFNKKFFLGTPFCHYVPKLGCLLALTKSHRLSVNEKVFYQGVSSFSVAGEFLLATTFSNLLYVISLDEVLKCLEKCNHNTSSAVNLFADLFQNGRQIERGAALVGHEPFGTRVWLQMARGNLETIHPRPLIVHKLKRAIDVLKFGEALSEMRRHRIDTNLLFDHNYEIFMQNVAKFLEQVEIAEHLNLFITTLKEEDTRYEMFLPYYRHLADASGQTASTVDAKDATASKRKKRLSVAEICACIRETLQQRLQNDGICGYLNGNEMILSILSCYFMEHKINEALIYVKSQLSNATFNSTDFFRNSVNYLAVLVNEQDLFKHALKTYDMELAVNVLSFTNRDPKELLPILNNFRAYTPADYRNYHVDLYLEDYSSALKHIVHLAIEDDNRFEECHQLIEQQKFYAKAFILLFHTARKQEICKICAAFALKQRSYNEAAYLFYMAGEMSSALDSFMLAQNFRACRFLYDLREVDRESFQKALYKIDQQLGLQRKSRARIDALWCEQSPIVDKPSREFLNCCVEAFEWETAFHYAVLYTNSQQGDGMAMLRLRLTERVIYINGQMSTWTRYLLAHFTRLEVVRAIKLRHLREWLEQEAHGEDEERGGAAFDAQSETLSEASSSSVVSHISQLSKISTATSRKRKQIERKKKHIKEGSHYEDSALLTALKEIYKAVDLLQGELGALFFALLATGALVEGRNLQKNFCKLFELVERLKSKIWPQFLEAQHLPGPLIEIYRCADGIVRLPPEGLMPPRFQIEDEIVAYEIRKKFSEWKLLMFENHE